MFLPSKTSSIWHMSFLLDTQLTRKVPICFHRCWPTEDDLTTSNPDILAVGDVIERADTRFTHMSGTMAGMADAWWSVGAPQKNGHHVFIANICCHTLDPT